MFFNFFGKRNNDNDEFDNIKGEALREIIRQSKLAANIAAGVVAASAMMTLGGVGLLYVGKISEASLTAGVGALATMTTVQYAQQTKKELLEMLKELEEDN